MTQVKAEKHASRKRARTSDICANRHRGNRFSRAAHLAGDKVTDRHRVLRAIKASSSGKTCDELAQDFDCAPNQISGRLTELKARGLIVRSGSRPTRTGNKAGVYVFPGPPAHTQPLREQQKKGAK